MLQVKNSKILSLILGLAVISGLRGADSRPTSLSPAELERILDSALDEFISDEPAVTGVSPATSISPTKSPESVATTPETIAISTRHLTASPSAYLEFAGKSVLPLTVADTATLTDLVHKQLRWVAKERNAQIEREFQALQKRLTMPFTPAQAYNVRQRLEHDRRFKLPELETFAHITRTGEILFALVPVDEKAKVENFALLPAEQANKRHFIEKLRERYGRFNPPIELVKPRGVIKVIPGWDPGELTRK